MCWNMPNDETCVKCQEYFDNCKHVTTFINKDNKKQCVFCDKVVR
jgi:hypothetical protein